MFMFMRLSHPEAEVKNEGETDTVIERWEEGKEVGNDVTVIGLCFHGLHNSFLPMAIFPFFGPFFRKGFYLVPYTTRYYTSIGDHDGLVDGLDDGPVLKHEKKTA